MNRGMDNNSDSMSDRNMRDGTMSDRTMRDGTGAVGQAGERAARADRNQARLFPQARCCSTPPQYPRRLGD